jgi:hypothetical protein
MSLIEWSERALGDMMALDKAIAQGVRTAMRRLAEPRKATSRSFGEWIRHNTVSVSGTGGCDSNSKMTPSKFFVCRIARMPTGKTVVAREAGR